MNNIPKQPSTRAQKLFEQTRLRIQGPHAAERLWERLFNATERKMLGRSLQHAYQEYPSAARMWAKVKQVNYSAAVIDVAEILNFLTSADADWLRREGNELPSDPAEAMQVAVERGDLVLSLRDRKLHWSGREYEIPFGNHPTLWDFLETACRFAKSRDSIGWDAFGDNKSENYVAQTKSKLSKLPGFPIELIDLFVNAGPKRQRLDLEPERIHLFD